MAGCGGQGTLWCRPGLVFFWCEESKLWQEVVGDGAQKLCCGAGEPQGIFAPQFFGFCVISLLGLTVCLKGQVKIFLLIALARKHSKT